MSEQTQMARTWTESPASAAIKVQLNGYDVTLTLRGETVADVLPKLQSAIAWLEQHGAQPTGAAASAPDTSANGPREGDPAWCSIHNCQMARKEKNGDVCTATKPPTARGAGARKPSERPCLYLVLGGVCFVVFLPQIDTHGYQVRALSITRVSWPASPGSQQHICSTPAICPPLLFRIPNPKPRGDHSICAKFAPEEDVMELLSAIDEFILDRESLGRASNTIKFYRSNPG